jgi:hypothetical protein
LTERGGPIGVLVANVSRHAAHAVLGQALCLTVGAFCVTLALALLGGSELDVVGAHIAAATTSLAVGAAWRAEHPIDARQLVRRADGALGLRGAFEAALEEEARAPRGAFAALTAQRLLRAARPRELRAAAEPSAVPFAAVPLAAAVLLAVAATHALERRVQRSSGHELAFAAADDHGQAMARAVRQGSISTETLSELAAATAEARILGASLAGSGVAHAAGPDGGDTPSQAGAEGAPRAAPSPNGTAAELARRVDALAAQLTTASDGVRSALDRAALALDTLSLGNDLAGPLEHGSARESGESVTAARSRAMMGGSRVSDETVDRAPAGSRDAVASDALSSPAGGGDPRLDAVNAVQDRGASDNPVRGPTAAPAVAAGRPWPNRYDALAERWSRQHARAAANDPHSPTEKQ